MRTTNGLDVPTGWGQRQAADRRPCPVCHKATDVVTSKGSGYTFKVLDDHRRTERGVYGRQACPGSGRLAP